MPTSKPRLNVTLEPELYELLMEIGRYQGRSAASIARDLVESAAPAFRSLVAVQRAQAAAMDAHPEQVQKAVSDALQEHFGIGLEQMDLLDALASVLGAGEPDDAGADRADRSASEDRTDRTAVASADRSC